MPPRGRPPKPRTSRMHAAIDAMKPYGFTQEVVMAKMRQLLKVYVGEYMFIEQDAYNVLLESLIDDQDKEREQNQLDVAPGEASNLKVAPKGEKVKESDVVVPTDRFIDIPVCSSTTLTVLPPPPPPPPSLLPPPPPPPSSPPPPPPPPPPPSSPPPSSPPPPPPIQEAVLPHSPHVLFSSLSQPENVQPRRRKPCYGWICDDNEELQFIMLPSSLDGQISPPKSPPAQPKTRYQAPQPEWNNGRKNPPKRRSRWDLKPEDM